MPTDDIVSCHWLCIPLYPPHVSKGQKCCMAPLVVFRLGRAAGEQTFQAGLCTPIIYIGLFVMVLQFVEKTTSIGYRPTCAYLITLFNNKFCVNHLGHSDTCRHLHPAAEDWST